jgi:hypothetical protein
MKGKRPTWPRKKGWENATVRSLTLLALLSTLAAPMPAVFAQTDAAQCVAIAADADRLACYDAIFLAGTGAPGDAALLESEQLIPARPSGRAPATMAVSCEAGTLTIAFSFAGNTMSALGRDAGITLQYDLQAARSRTLMVNADNTAILLRGSDAAAFLDGLAGATNLTVRVTPVSSRSLSVRFRVDAFAPQVAPVRAACGS